MYCFDHRHRVRYRECDPMGFVYHAHYVDYFEAARTEALRQAGVSVKGLEEDGILLPVLDLAVEYKRSGHYDDLLTVRCTIAEPPGVRLKTTYEVYDTAASQLLCTAHVTVCFFDARRRQPIPAPDRVLEALRAAIRAGAATAPGASPAPGCSPAGLAGRPT